ncbi:hypothetical protein [Streptomyces sp. WMMC940]|uniref:hypothetical protein n=1 Tax=Streptomyces sp. WMMC940 TaxID=3015153 RepID=UPI0022B6C9EB|nr:hypothetical protein [Streptomyces sp. WMMC940]MCZ7457673.1 hypothetical protein [Streptomyces sp. WMMC940]
MERTGTTRRRALLATGAAAAAVLTGCTTDEPGARSATPRSESAETALRRRSAELSGALLPRYDAVLTAHPALAARLAPLRAEVVRHVEALAPTGSRPLPGTSPDPSVSRPASPSSPAPSASGPARPGPSSTASPPAPPAPADAGAAVRELAAAERTTADGHTAALSGAPPEYARLLASVAAAGAVHAYLLTEGSR